MLHRVDTKTNVWWAMLLLLPMFCVGLFLRGYWTPDEPREADITWRMSYQVDRSVPQLAAQPFMEKPPLSYWLGAVSQKLFGISAAATRIPNLLYVVMACVCVGLLAQNMAGRRAGFVASLAFGSMFIVYQVGIWLAPDASLLASSALALLGVWRGYNAERTHTKLLWYTVMHVGALLGFMAKSAPGWLVPGLALLTLIAMERRWRELLQWTLWLGLLLQLAVIGAWLATILKRADGIEILKVMFWNNLAGRFTDIHVSGKLNYASEHKNWFGKYLVESPYYVFPWVFCVWAALRLGWQHLFVSANRSWRFVFAASMPFALLLSLATTARGVYFAPVCVGLAVSVALWLEAVDTGPNGFTVHWALHAARYLVLALVFLLCVGLTVIGYGVSSERFRCLVGLGLLLGLFVYALRVRLDNTASLHFSTTYGLYAACLVVASMSLSPLFDRLQNLQAIATAIHRDTRFDELALLNPDETTVAMFDYGVGGLVPDFYGKGAALQGVVKQWLQAKTTHRLIAMLPGRGAGPLQKLFRSTMHDDDGLAGELQRDGVVKIERRYALPDGRRYAVLAAPRACEPPASAS